MRIGARISSDGGLGSNGALGLQQDLDSRRERSSFGGPERSASRVVFANLLEDVGDGVLISGIDVSGNFFEDIENEFSSLAVVEVSKSGSFGLVRSFNLRRKSDHSPLRAATVLVDSRAIPSSSSALELFNSVNSEFGVFPSASDVLDAQMKSSVQDDGLDVGCFLLVSLEDRLSNLFELKKSSGSVVLYFQSLVVAVRSKSVVEFNPSVLRVEGKRSFEVAVASSVVSIADSAKIVDLSSERNSCAIKAESSISSANSANILLGGSVDDSSTILAPFSVPSASTADIDLGVSVGNSSAILASRVPVGSGRVLAVIALVLLPSSIGNSSAI